MLLLSGSPAGASVRTASVVSVVEMDMARLGLCSDVDAVCRHQTGARGRGLRSGKRECCSRSCSPGVCGLLARVALQGSRSSSGFDESLEPARAAPRPCRPPLRSEQRLLSVALGSGRARRGRSPG